MIVDALYYLAGSFFATIAFLFSLVSIVIPSGVTNSIVYFASYLNYAKGIFPVATAMQAMLFVLSVWVGLYGIKILLALFAMIPWIGGHFNIHHGKDIQSKPAEQPKK